MKIKRWPDEGGEAENKLMKVQTWRWPGGGAVQTSCGRNNENENESDVYRR